MAGLLTGRHNALLRGIHVSALGATLFHDRKHLLQLTQEAKQGGTELLAMARRRFEISLEGLHRFFGANPPIVLEPKYVFIPSVQKSTNDQFQNTVMGAGLLLGQIFFFKRFFHVPFRFSVTNALFDIGLELRELRRSGKGILDLEWKIANVSLFCDQVVGARVTQLFYRFRVPNPIQMVQLTREHVASYLKMHTRIALETIPLRYATVALVDGDVPNFGFALNMRSFSIDYLLGLAKLRFGYLGFRTTAVMMVAEKALLGHVFDYTPLYSGKGYFLEESREVFREASLKRAIPFFRKTMASRRHFLTAALQGELRLHFQNGPLAPVYELDEENIRILAGFIQQGVYSTKEITGLQNIIDALARKQERDLFEEMLLTELKKLEMFLIVDEKVPVSLGA